MMAIVPEPASVVVRGADAPRELWLARILVPLITLAGSAIVWAAWGLAPWYVYALGVAVAAFGVWLQVLVEMSGREMLTVGGDGSIWIHSPGLLARDVRVDRQDVVSVTYVEPALNQPPGETLLSLLGRGGYLRIELRDPSRPSRGAMDQLLMVPAGRIRPQLHRATASPDRDCRSRLPHRARHRRCCPRTVREVASRRAPTRRVSVCTRCCESERTPSTRHDRADRGMIDRPLRGN